MLQSINHLHGFTIVAEHREIGTLEDAYFDDAHWTVRYLVVDTGSWLTGRRVLISPRSVDAMDWPARTISVRLTCEQVKNSPEISMDRPVSRQHEEELSAYYGWPCYWTGDPFGMEPMMVPVPLPPPPPPDHKGNPHLRSAHEVKGYHIGATDGPIGHLSDFAFDDATWEIAFLIVDAGSWLHARRVLLRPRWISGIVWDERTVEVSLSREVVRTSPLFTPVFPISSEYAAQLLKHYDPDA